MNIHKSQLNFDVNNKGVLVVTWPIPISDFVILYYVIILLCLYYWIILHHIVSIMSLYYNVLFQYYIIIDIILH